MASLHGASDGDVRVHHLTEDERTIDRQLVARHGRSARTLVKEGPLRLTIIALGAGGDLPEHSTDGPVSVHALEGTLEFTVAGERYRLRSGDVLVLPAGVRHSATSTDGGVFLLTVVHAPSPGTPLDQT